MFLIRQRRRSLAGLEQYENPGFSKKVKQFQGKSHLFGGSFRARPENLYDQVYGNPYTVIRKAGIHVCRQNPLFTLGFSCCCWFLGWVFKNEMLLVDIHFGIFTD